MSKEIWDSEAWLVLLETQIAGIRLDDGIAAAIADALAMPEGRAVVPIERGRMEEIVVRGSEFVSARSSPEAYTWPHPCASAGGLGAAVARARPASENMASARPEWRARQELSARMP